MIEFTGAITANIAVIVPALAGYQAVFRNNTTGAFTLTVKTLSGTGVAIASGKTALLGCDGTNVFRMTSDA